jgi:hypothetical protein
MTQMLDGLPIGTSAEYIDTFGEICDVARRYPHSRFSIDEVGNAIIELINEDGNVLGVDSSNHTDAGLLQEVV